MDCHHRVLHFVGGGELSCFLVQFDEGEKRRGTFSRERVGENTPPFPTKKYANNVGGDFYTP